MVAAEPREEGGEESQRVAVGATKLPEEQVGGAPHVGGLRVPAHGLGGLWSATGCLMPTPPS